MSAGPAVATPAEAVAGGRRRQGRLAAWLRVPPASERVSDWHVAPAVDACAYHFSWLWLLAPLLLCGDGHFGDYFAGFVILMVVNFVHRHFTLPYVYLDRETFSRHPWRFTLVPLLLIAAFLASPALERGTIPAGVIPGVAHSVPGLLIASAVAFAAGAWNFWHVYAQKFGILRLYAAKARGSGGAPHPRWVDRLFLLGWLPFLVLHLGTRYRETVLSGLPEAGAWLALLLDALAAVEPWLWTPCLALVIASVGIFAHSEWRASRLRNAPRVSMAVGMLGLHASFLVFNPVKVYMAFAFSHGLEYIVFVWAYQRRHYQRRESQETLLGRLHRRPWFFYPIFGLGLTGIYLMLRSWGDRNYWEVPEWEVAGATIGLWVFYWSVYQSFVHFYYDGFLWKVRRPAYREDL